MVPMATKKPAQIEISCMINIPVVVGAIADGLSPDQIVDFVKSLEERSIDETVAPLWKHFSALMMAQASTDTSMAPEVIESLEKQLRDLRSAIYPGSEG